MATSYDEGFERISRLCDEVAASKDLDINEDTTRLRFIDTVLFECLDWNKFTQVGTEEHVETGILDYSLRAPELLAVLEAKKMGISFKLPADLKNDKLKRSIAAIKSLDKKDKDKTISAAIDQCASYALDRGAPTAVVSNGWQFIAFDTQPGPGRSWRDGDALVFLSLEQVRDEFPVFWEVLSVEGVRQNLLQRKLAEGDRGSPCPKRSSIIANFNRAKNRNNLQADLQILGDLVLGGRIFEDRKLFQENCYCASGALSQFSRASRTYLEDRYPEIFQATAGTPSLTPATTRKGPESALVNLTNIRKPIILLGEVGVGKTTFLEHLFMIEWQDKSEDLIVLRMDLGDKPSRVADLPSMVNSEIERELLESYDIDIQENGFLRGVYHGELARFRKSPSGALAGVDDAAYHRAELDYLLKLQASFDEHLKAIFKHLVRGRRKIVVLIFDNVDQRDADMQKAAFIQAQVAASTWDIFVMLALRPKTFVESKAAGALSGYHPRAFTISPPRFDLLIDKRLETALKMLDGTLPLPVLGANVRMQVHETANYLRMLRRSFAHNQAIASFCEDISGGSMRLALDYVVGFMSCGHVDAKKILTLWAEGETYVIPYHEFVRGVMYGDREYYTGSESPILNVYDYNSSDRRELFVVLVVMSILAKAADADNAGFLAVDVCSARLTAIGYSRDQARNSIVRCVQARLIEDNLKTGQFAVDTSHVRLTSAGSHYLDHLTRSFVYTDAVSIDTPICDVEAFKLVKDVRMLDERVARSRAFLSYLDSVAREFPKLSQELNWQDVSSAVRGDIQRAEDSSSRRSHVR
ncbi:MAG: hypothetical protein EPO40_18885 [Myxococcaceae bacterium]|nr:MAG: hypothetical protein EPO40_18885 [Myxococcaceae bacterium]